MSLFPAPNIPELPCQDHAWPLWLFPVLVAPGFLGRKDLYPRSALGGALPWAGPAVIIPIHPEQGQDSSGSAIPRHCSSGGCPR